MPISSICVNPLVYSCVYECKLRFSKISVSFIRFLLYLSAYQYFRCDRWWVKSDRRIAVLITLLTICARIFDYFVYYCVK